MDPADSVPSFPELVTIADCILEETGEDEDALVRRLETLPAPVRNELFVSDLLNAWQVFYYFFRIVPDELIQERLDLEPASSLVEGVTLDEIDLLERVFRIKNARPEILVTDGENMIRTFSGQSAFEDSRIYIESTL
ncbi:MAG: hypothetical protein LUQ31_09740 [Methanoregula sp.]|nr:hypothetical protein [Methanoregula sp.]